MKKVKYIAILLIMALFASCESVMQSVLSPENMPGTIDAIIKSGTAISKAMEEITPEQEYYIGRAVGANITEKYKPYTSNTVLTAYLNQICRSITVNSPRPDLYKGYHVMMLDSEEINAFATSGGHIFITKGLLRSATSEDALAGIIAHEIAHIQLQHSLKAIKNSRITNAIMVTGTSAVSVAAQGTSLGELTDIFGESVNEVVTTMVTNGYSQDQEYEADNLALALMAAAGYEPSSLIEMLRVLKDNQAKSPGGFGKTHPSPDNRIKNAEKSINKYKVTDTRGYRQDRYQKNMTKI